MIIAKLTGGLGNQLFQYAFSRCLSHKLGAEMKLDINWCEEQRRKREYSHGYYRLEAFNIQENFATQEEIDRVRRNNKIGKFFSGGYKIEALSPEDDIYVDGHFMHSDIHFSEISDIILREFTLRNPLHRNSAAWESRIKSSPCAVSLHIRLNDYANDTGKHIAGVLPLDYYRSAIYDLKKSFPNMTIFVFSDDLNLARKNCDFDVPTEFVEGCESDTEEFWLMTLCKHNIIANSTFSWWAAWLNQNPGKKVFMPDPWTRSGLWTNGIPEGWTTVHVDFDKNIPIDFPPALSVIVYSKNNLPTLGITLSTILNQRAKNLEVILLDDASSDSSENFYNQFVGRNDFTVVKLNRELGKAAAFNRGMELARGDQILFLTGKEFIFPNAVDLLYQALDSEVVLSAQIIEENPEGDMSIGLADRKFSLRGDEAFKDLKFPSGLNLNTDQKLSLLANRQINTALGTKFFKRTFLEKNNLRFNENARGEAEILFFLDAFILAEGMMVLPAAFYGRLK